MCKKDYTRWNVCSTHHCLVYNDMFYSSSLHAAERVHAVRFNLLCTMHALADECKTGPRSDICQHAPLAPKSLQPAVICASCARYCREPAAASNSTDKTRSCAGSCTHADSFAHWYIVQEYIVGWLGSRVVSVLDSGAEGPGFKSQPRRCRVTVLGKLVTPIVPLFTKQQNW